jgi:hypothetical protein
VKASKSSTAIGRSTGPLPKKSTKAVVAVLTMAFVRTPLDRSST